LLDRNGNISNPKCLSRAYAKFWQFGLSEMLGSVGVFGSWF
jgi:hypothetical protein